MQHPHDAGQPAAGSARIGGDLVVETLVALGAESVVGIPGQHALGLFDALRRSPLRFLSARVENNAGFMADGIARTSGTVAPLFVSTGPGALTALPALQEAAASSIPVLVVSAQVPTPGLGGGRHGYLHELPRQSDAFAGVVKSVVTVRNTAQVASAIADAWALALTAPAGPVLVEIPQDVLLEKLGPELPVVTDITADVSPRAARRELVSHAASLLAAAARPAIYAGGGVVRADATAELTELAELLDAPVIETFGGKGAIASDHPLNAGSWIEDIAVTEFLESADVLLVVGSGLGELSSNYHTFAPAGTVIHIEADLGKLNSNHAGVGLHADARAALAALLDELRSTDRTPRADAREEALASITRLKAVVQERLDQQSLAKERSFLEELREAVPADADTFWDMTMVAYWAWSAWPTKNGSFASAQGSGGLGYALPAALGAAFARQGETVQAPVLAFSGDGGAMYGIAELATLAQHELDVTWVIVNDGGYGILAEYMESSFGVATATSLATPDFVALAESFGIRARRETLATAPSAIAEAVAERGPAVIVIDAQLGLFEPTHLHRTARA